MTDARLEVNDGLGRRVVPLDKPQLTIGRRTENDLRLTGSDVSRDHAEIVMEDGALRAARPGLALRHLRQRGADHRAHAGARRPAPVRARGGADIVFLIGDASSSGPSGTPVTAVSDLRQIAALLEGLRALGSGRVLDDVLALVLDSAIDVTGAERGFIMLAAGDQRSR